MPASPAVQGEPEPPPSCHAEVLPVQCRRLCREELLRCRRCRVCRTPGRTFRVSCLSRHNRGVTGVGGLRLPPRLVGTGVRSGTFLRRWDAQSPPFTLDRPSPQGPSSLHSPLHSPWVWSGTGDDGGRSLLFTRVREPGCWSPCGGPGFRVLPSPNLLHTLHSGQVPGGVLPDDRDSNLRPDRGGSSDLPGCGGDLDDSVPLFPSSPLLPSSPHSSALPW